MRVLTTRMAMERPTAYDGTQLHAHFLRTAFGVRGDAAVAFRGPCEVAGHHLVDLEDREAGNVIRAAEMLHLIVERFDPDLTRAVCLQRLLAAAAADRVRQMAAPAGGIARRGDDVFVGEGKLTVSIATISPVSTLIHFGVNIDGSGAPVPVASLSELAIGPEAFAAAILDDLAAEVAGITDALSKVRPAAGGGAGA